MAREDRISTRCDLCGTEVWGDNENELAVNLRSHTQDQHDTNLSDDQVREKIRESVTATSGRVVR
ncbi:MAG: DUF1059 domain-containing protein [Chloroflexi bacterium]|jgi:predicted small metal-binding protein|nr:DUF1059 domain-containing protein [Chloroflexota bacterium]